MKLLNKSAPLAALLLCLLLAAPAAAGLNETLNDIDMLIDEVQRARTVLRDVTDTGDQSRIRSARERLQMRENQLDQARINALAREAGVSSARVSAMRSSGMGWGRIAKELGVHPSVLGMGKGKGRGTRKGYVEDDPYALDGAYEDGGKKPWKKYKGKGKGKGKGRGKGRP